MHALVLGLFHQRANPAVVIDHAPQAAQMRGHCADHARHRCHRFEHDGAMAVAFREKRVGDNAQQFGEGKRQMIRHADRCVVCRRLRVDLALVNERERI